MDEVDNENINQYLDPETGFLMVPGTRRADGSWRKPRRIKEGYIPPDEVPLYESKGKQWAKTLEIKNIPGSVCPKAKRKNKKKKKKSSCTQGSGKKATGLETEAKVLKQPQFLLEPQIVYLSCYIEPIFLPLPHVTDSNFTAQHCELEPSIDPRKKLRNLKKKLRDIESLQARIFSGQLDYPEPEQFVKLGRKETIEAQIQQLEDVLENVSF